MSAEFRSQHGRERLNSSQQSVLGAVANGVEPYNLEGICSNVTKIVMPFKAHLWFLAAGFAVGGFNDRAGCDGVVHREVCYSLLLSKQNAVLSNLTLTLAPVLAFCIALVQRIYMLTMFVGAIVARHLVLVQWKTRTLPTTRLAFITSAQSCRESGPGKLFKWLRGLTTRTVAVVLFLFGSKTKLRHRALALAQSLLVQAVGFASFWTGVIAPLGCSTKFAFVLGHVSNNSEWGLKCQYHTS